MQRQVRDAGLEGRFEYVGEVDRQGKIDFLRGLDVLSVPTVYREPKGLFVLESLANAVPVVLPAHGAFPELIEATGGGVLVEPGRSTRSRARSRSCCAIRRAVASSGVAGARRCSVTTAPTRRRRRPSASTTRSWP